MKMKRQTNILECTKSEPRATVRGSLLLATVAGVALFAVGCSTSYHRQGEYSSTTTYSTPAAGAAQSSSGQSSGYVTSSTTTTTADQRTDVITDPGTLPRYNISPDFVGRPVNFGHMRVERVDSDGFIEVTSDDGSRFFVAGYDTNYNLKPGDFVVVSGTIVDPDSVSTALDKKTGYYMMRHPYYIWVERIQVIPA